MIFTLRPSAPWYNEEIGKAKRHRRRLERRWRASRLCIDKEIYIKQCQIVNDMIKEAKTTYYSSAISNNKYNQKVLFDTVDKLLHRKPEKYYPTTSSKTELVNNFGDFFSNKIAVLRSELANISTYDNQLRPAKLSTQCVEFRVFQTVTEQEVENIVDANGNKSCELDPIPATILKGCKKTLLPTFTNIINKSLETACMPVQLKEAMLKPKLKKSNLEFEEYSNFRPISNLKFLSKIIEKAVAAQLMEHLVNNNLEEPLQSAYKRFHSSETALLKVQNDILIAIDNQKCVVLLLLDMSAAFDTVDHEILLERMSKRFGIKDKVLEWFQSYLQNRTQTVMIDGVKSAAKDLNWGVPQGSVLGPILYLLYTSPIGDIIRRHELDFHFYADDSQLYLAFEPTTDEQPGALVRIETCVREIDSWMVSNKLKLNGDKTELLVINARHRPCPLIDHIDVSNFKIQPSDTASNIGVTFDRHMSLDQHVTNICKTCFFHLRQIAKIRDYLSTADTETLVHSLITSKLDSCNSLLYGLPKLMIDRLQNVQNSAARLIARRRKFDHITPVMKELHWLPVSQRIIYKILLITYKALNGLAPSYIRDMLQPLKSTINLRSSMKGLLSVPPIKLVNYGQRSFSYAAPKLWNELPDSVRHSESISIFKTKLKTYLFK